MQRPTLCFGAILALAGTVGIAAVTPASARTRDHERLIYSFAGGSDGESSIGALVSDAGGALYGTTLYGGVAGSPACSIGCGTVFKLTPNSRGEYSESVVYAFPSLAAGAEPEAGVVFDAAGAIYGTTWAGGGTVFKLTPTPSGYTEQVLVSFTGRNGQFPVAPVLVGGSGTLYGTTSYGGKNKLGTVFELRPKGKGYIERILHDFGAETIDGAVPYSGLLMDAAGNLFGTTQLGGGFCGDWGTFGCGTVFELVRSGTGYRERVIYRFLGFNDGEMPMAGVSADASGNLYGTTFEGGTGNCLLRCGIVYKLTPSGSGYAESVIHLFAGGPTDGGAPRSGVIVRSDGSLFGTTDYGGADGCEGAGCGVVYELTPSSSGYREAVLYSFQGAPDAWAPYASLVVDRRGSLLGASSQGGANGLGAVFEVKE